MVTSQQAPSSDAASCASATGRRDRSRRSPRRWEAIALGVALIAAAPAAADAAVVPLEPCAVNVEVSSRAGLHWTADDVRRFREEAGRVWTGRGVVLCWPDRQTGCPSTHVTVHVRLAENVPSRPSDAAPVREALGWIGFNERTGPGPVIVLSIRRAMELLGRAERAARRLSDLPGLVPRLLPRALGRALSHELGHFLLARRAHSRTGVMREGLRPEDLADTGDGQRLQLARDDERALARRCGDARLRMAALSRGSER